MRRQINEFELEYLYHQIGAAVWHLQYVEDALVPLIVIKGLVKELSVVEESVYLEHELSLKKLTLGQLIGRATKLEIIDKNLLDSLRSFNEERKWVVHNSIFESGDGLYTDEGRNLVFARLEAFVDEAKKLQKRIATIITDYAVSQGMCRSQLEDTARNQVSKLRGA